MRIDYLFIRSLQKRRSAGTSSCMHTILKVLTVTLLMLEAAGCGCSAVGCPDSYSVEFNKVSKVWEPGSYVVAVDADGEKNSCTFEMPFVADPVCTSNLRMQLNLLPISDASNETKGLDGVAFFSTPAGVQVTVARDGVTLGSSYFLPSYTINEPNGALCGPTCYVARNELSVL